MQDAARELGFHLVTVRDLIRANKIKTYRVRASPAARGIDAEGMALLRSMAGNKEGGKPKPIRHKTPS